MAGQWTGVVGTLAVDGYGAYKVASGGIKAVKAVKTAMPEGEDLVLNGQPLTCTKQAGSEFREC
ncbi:hypothetical protein [Streptomyces sp. NPDC001068]|uniref:hypothetical protein n=1 Tax=Streptomyces sp. NPDC001068 TaxID=3364544 RepID=UPI00368785D0